MFWFLLFYLHYVAVFCENENNFRLVHLAQGAVRGYKDPKDGIYSFYGIPYATVPKGNDRFKAPQPAPIWSVTFDAIDEEIICPQKDLMNVFRASKVIKEECLIANVYVPNTNKTNLPVLIIVHGGAYSIGWGNMFTPKTLVKSKKIIAVTFNYRLGPQGFLCLGTKDVPGNAGMKDQVALVRWVKTNIASFGGDPDDIIISGFSSGASAVDVLLLSKMTKGLIKKAIPESGAGLGPYGVQLDPIENAKIYAKLLKFDNVDDLEALEEFYKSVPLDILNSAQVTQRKDSVTIMAPCIERDIGEERFLHDSPINIIKSGDFEKLPLLYGFTDMDGLLKLPQLYDWTDEMNKNFSVFLPADLQFKNQKEKEEIAQQIRRFYFGQEQISPKTALKFVYYFTDVMFVCPILRSAKYQVEAGHDQIYLYEYSYYEDRTPFIPHTDVRGANHCAQTYGILDGFWNDTIIDEKDVSDDIIQRKIFIKPIWLNFMTEGRPIPQGSELPQWPPVGVGLSPHMSINKTFVLKGRAPIEERYLFWEKIYDRYYRYPVPPVLPTEYRNLNDDKVVNLAVPVTVSFCIYLFIFMLFVQNILLIAYMFFVLVVACYFVRLD